MKRLLALLTFVAGVGLVAEARGVVYSTTEVLNPENGVVERRMYADGFHFGVLARDPSGRLFFRVHPGLADPDGWGTTWYLGPFLAGGEPTEGSITALNVSSAGVAARMAGPVKAAANGSYGTWAFDLHVSYDSAAQRVAGGGTLSVRMPGSLAAADADLNLSRIASNYLDGVPLQTGGVGDTGDMVRAVTRYRHGAADWMTTWVPDEQPGHFPTDAAPQLSITVVGQINTVDAVALGSKEQINVARKPTFGLGFTSASDPLSGGYFYDTARARDFTADNVGINHLLLKRNSTLANLDFQAAMFGALAGLRAARDFNRDGMSDIVWTHTGTGDRYAWFMNGTALAGNAYLGKVPPNWKIAGTEDFDGDGHPDILWHNDTGGEVYVWRMNGTKLLGNAFVYTLPTVWQISAVGDFNADGKPDIVWTNTATGERYGWLMNGTTIASSVYLGTVSTNWRIVGTGDFDGDGKTDILWHDDTGGAVYVWRMNGTALKGNAYIYTLPIVWQVSGAGDFNGDGKPDILWTNNSTGERYVWLMNGTAIASSVSLGKVAPVWTMAP